MAAPQFVHLRLHSEYSITDGVVRIDDAIAKASEDGMGALAQVIGLSRAGVLKNPLNSQSL